MNQTPDQTRESKLYRTELPTDPKEVARLEAKNVLRQTDAIYSAIENALSSGKTFKLKPSLIMNLNRLAIEGTAENAGVYRSNPIGITNSAHEPPPPEEVPALVEEMCDYINEHQDATPVHLSAYLMWRINWIHPFEDGNGRTARATSYAVLCILLGHPLPGANTIPDQISTAKPPYWKALEAADEAWESGQLDVSELEMLLSNLLAAQLVNVLRVATGRDLGKDGADSGHGTDS